MQGVPSSCGDGVGIPPLAFTPTLVASSTMRAPTLGGITKYVHIYPTDITHYFFNKNDIPTLSPQGSRAPLIWITHYTSEKLVEIKILAKVSYQLIPAPYPYNYAQFAIWGNFGG